MGSPLVKSGLVIVTLGAAKTGTMSSDAIAKE
jgi:hypothetical protein